MALVVFDVGEVLVDESRLWLRRAEQLGVPPFTLFAVLGATIAAGRPHRSAFDLLGVDVAQLLDRVDRAEDPADGILPEDLYPDVVPAMEALRAAGHRLGVAANQPRRATAELERLGMPVEFVLTSGDLGVAKPSAAFFRHVAERAARPPAEVVYVGDRLDNDVVPAATAGMLAVLVRRGPWGVLHAERPDARRAAAVIGSLLELPAVLQRRGPPPDAGTP